MLPKQVQARRRNFAFYQEALGHLPGIRFMPEAPWGCHNRWLTVILIDPARFGAGRETVCLPLEAENIEARPVWKPMHRQPVFAGYESVGGAVAEALFRDGRCLPSGPNLVAADLAWVATAVGATAS